MPTRSDSTSFLNPNGDRTRGKLGKLDFILKKSLENAWGVLARPKFDVVPQDAFITNEQIRKNKAGGNPARVLSNLFWRGIDWPHLSQELGEIRLADFGCGDGNFSVKAKNWFGLEFKHFGYDVAEPKTWKGTQPKANSFFIFDGKSFEKVVEKKPNLIVSQSALEHVPADASFFETVRNYSEKQNFPIVQIHLVPSAACLATYLWHGFRHYTPAALNRISAMYQGNHRFKVVTLGGVPENLYHFAKVTIPEMILKKPYRQKNPEKYSKDLLRTMSRRKTNRSVTHSSFLALIIESNCNDIVRPRQMT